MASLGGIFGGDWVVEWSQRPAILSPAGDADLAQFKGARRWFRTVANGSNPS